MAVKDFSASDVKQSDDEIAVIESKNFVKLRKVDSSGNYDPSGKYKEGTFTLEPLKGTGIASYIGFFHRPNTEAGNVLYQVKTSKNGDWYYYNSSSSSWEVAQSSSDWTTETEMDAYLEDVDGGIGRYLQLRLKLVPETDVTGYPVKSPVLRNICIYYEFIGSFMVDIKRSIKHFLDGNFRPRFRDEFRFNEKLDSVSFQSEYDDINVKMTPPAKVFNLDNDPKKKQNLFKAINNNKLELKKQTKGNMEAFYHVKVPTFVNPADEQMDVNKATLPSVLVNFPIIEEESNRLHMTETGLVEKSEAKKYARIRKKGPLIYRITVNLTIQADRERQALPMADEVRHIFNSAKPVKIPSVQAGFKYDVIQYVDTINPDVVEDSRIVYQTEFQIFGYDFGNEAIFENVKMGESDIDVPLVENIKINSHSKGKVEIQKV